MALSLYGRISILDPNRRGYDVKLPGDNENPEKSLLAAKLAILKASPCVVCLSKYFREEKKEEDNGSKVGKDDKTDPPDLVACSGTIVECEQDEEGGWIGTILTSASLLGSPGSLVRVCLADRKVCSGEVQASDLHYNIAVVKIKLDVPVPTAVLRHLDDCMPLSIEALRNPKSFQLRSQYGHSSPFNIHPGSKVIALGRRGNVRACNVGGHLLASPGKFSIDWCDLDCRELFKASCTVAPDFIGGPLINSDGEVIGVNFYHDHYYTPFLPINIAFRCFEQLKRHKKVNHPSLGMEVTNLYAASLEFLGKIMLKFPGVSEGVLVEMVEVGSPADHAGIKPYDVIIQCGGSRVSCSLELFEIMWDKTGESVEVTVKRASIGDTVNLIMAVDEASPDMYNRWPIFTLSRKIRPFYS
ncbi:hypothetical protein Ancab_001225 [Ancistrocladus abbreviatus]